jgi:hypothetical protein
MHMAVNVDEHVARRRRRRLLAAGLDLAAVVATAAAIAVPLRLPAWTTLGVTGLVYHFALTAALGVSGGQLFVERYLDRLAALIPVRRRAVQAAHP